MYISNIKIESKIWFLKGKPLSGKKKTGKLKLWESFNREGWTDPSK